MLKLELSAATAREYESPHLLTEVIVKEILAVCEKFPKNVDRVFLLRYMELLGLDKREKAQCSGYLPREGVPLTEEQIRDTARLVAEKITNATTDFTEKLPPHKTRKREFGLKNINVDNGRKAEMEFCKTGVVETTTKKLGFETANDCVNWIIDKHAVETDQEMETPDSMEVNAVLVRTAAGKWVRWHLDSLTEYELNYVNLTLDYKKGIWHVAAVYETAAGLPHVWSRNIKEPNDLLQNINGQEPLTFADYLETIVHHKDLAYRNARLDEINQVVFCLKKIERNAMDEMYFNGAVAYNFWRESEHSWKGTKHFGYEDNHRLISTRPDELNFKNAFMYLLDRQITQ